MFSLNRKLQEQNEDYLRPQHKKKILKFFLNISKGSIYSCFALWKHNLLESLFLDELWLYDFSLVVTLMFLGGCSCSREYVFSYLGDFSKIEGTWNEFYGFEEWSFL